MARPTKETVDYFPHYTNGIRKTIDVLQNKYGNDGYAFWFRLLEFLCNQKGLSYNASSASNLEYLAAKAYVCVEVASKILDTLAELDAIDRELWTKNKIIWSVNLLENVKDAFKKRVNVIPEKPTVIDTNTNPNEFPAVETPQNGHKQGFPTPEIHESKLKKTKLKGNKTKEETTRSGCNYPPEMCDENLMRVVAEYENSGYGTVSSTITDFLLDLINDYSVEWVVMAIKEGAIQGKRKLSYVKGILKNWKADGKDSGGGKGGNSRGHSKSGKPERNDKSNEQDDGYGGDADLIL
jgi:DnaD/phage-associated family protein